MYKLVAGCCALLLVGVVVAAQQAPTATEAIMTKAKAIHAKAITIDTHVDIGGATYATPALDPGTRTNLKCDLVKMKEGGLKGVFLAVYVGQRPGPWDAAAYKAAYDQAMVKFDALHRLTETMHPELCELATSPEDVERIAKTGKRVIMTGVENGYPLGEDLSNVKKFYDLGARYITLTHSGHNQLGDSSSDRNPPLHKGLSDFGKKVVVEMNRLGVMVDVSHIAESSFWDVIKLSKAPIIASHSGCKAVNDVDRNLTDDQLTALAKNGGVVQIVALASYLKSESPERTEALRKLAEEFPLAGRGGRGSGGRGGAPGAPVAQAGQAGAGRGQAGQAGQAGQVVQAGGQRGQAPPLTPEQQAERDRQVAAAQERRKEIDAKYPAVVVTLKEYGDHIDHAVKVAGIDHVGIGTDFDGGGGFQGFNDHSEALNVTVELVRRGYSENDIIKIWGGNLLRVWRDVRKEALKEQGK
jgi:membrane dipeptidase